MRRYRSIAILEMERSHMQRANRILGNFNAAHLPLILAVGLLSTALLPAGARAQQQGQKAFPSAQAATRALFMAMKNNDDNAMIDILGPDAKSIVSSGDDIE